MKRITLLLITLFIAISIQAQENFKWDKVIDVPSVSGDELFLKAKKYIGSINGTQFSDEKNRIVYSKVKISGKYQHSKIVFNNVFFLYDLVILVKDNKIRLIAENVICSEWKYKNMPALDFFPGDDFNLEVDKYVPLMKDLKVNIDQSFKDIELIMNEPLTPIESNW